MVKSKQKTKNKWPLGLSIIRYLNGDNAKDGRAKFKSAILAVLLALLIGSIPILAFGGNPLLGYFAMFVRPFYNINLRQTFITISIFILLGAGIGVSFKTGLFNIGVTGQFMMSGFICVLLGITQSWPKGIGIIILILISILVGAFCALIPAILKAFFNVHEVVCTILLNWVFFFLIKFIIELPQYQAGYGSSLPVNDSMHFSIKNDSNDFIIVFLLAIIFVIGLFIVFKFTTFGYQLKVNGLSQTAAKYSGINTKKMIIYSMMISGAFAGLAGFLFYSTSQGRIPKLDKMLPTLGFEAITVALLAFSSPIGAIFSGMFYGIIYEGTNFMQAAGGNVTPQAGALALSIIIFISALINSFYNLHPIKSIINYFEVRHSYLCQQIVKKGFKERLETKNKFQKILKKLPQRSLVVQKRKKLWDQYFSELNLLQKKLSQDKMSEITKSKKIEDLKQNYKSQIDLLNNQDKSFVKKEARLILKEIKNKTKVLIKQKLDNFQKEILLLKWDKRHQLAHLYDRNLTIQELKDSKRKIEQKFKNAKLKIQNKWFQNQQLGEK